MSGAECFVSFRTNKTKSTEAFRRTQSSEATSLDAFNQNNRRVQSEQQTQEADATDALVRDSRVSTVSKRTIHKYSCLSVAGEQNC